MRNRWYDKTPDEILEHMNSSSAAGLSKKEAASRLRRDGANVIYPVSKASFKKYLLHVLTDLTAILLLITASVAAIIEGQEGAVVILAILLINYAISIFAYIKSQKVLEGMGYFAIPSAKVIRDAKLFMVKQEQLVRGDVIIVSAGDIVPADARLIEDDGLKVLETGICSSHEPVLKNAKFIEYRNLRPDDCQNMIFASTIVTEGKGKAVVCETGADTLVCQLGKNRPIDTHDKLRVVAKIKKYCSAWSLIMICMIFIMTLLNLVIGKNAGIFSIFMSSLSLAVSTMPELITAYVYIIVACGIFGAVTQYKNINSGALIKNASKIEDIKDINCLLIHKECIFSERDMKVESVFADGDIYGLNDKRPGAGMLRTMKYALISTGLYGAAKLVANNEKNENIYTSEEEAIITAAERCNVYDRRLDETYPILDHAEAAGMSLFETTLVKYQGDFLIALRGDAKEVLDRCTCYNLSDKVQALDSNKKNELMILAQKYIRNNYRVLAVATRNTTYNMLRRIGQAQTDLVFEGFIFIAQPLLPDAAKNISKCREAGIKVIMFCNDPDESNYNLARSLGIVTSPSDCTDVFRLREMSEDLIRANVTLYTLYEGLSTVQKRYIMRWLKEDCKYKIGVLGHQLDHIILLSEADAGFSEVITISEHAAKTGVDLTSRDIPVYAKNSKDSARGGCEALKFMSDVIVSKAEMNGNGGFNALVGAISTSKNIYFNLLHMVRYLLISQLARIFIMFWSIISGNTFLNSVQMLFCGLIVDMFAIIVIAFEKPPHNILKYREDTEKKLSLLPIYNAHMVLFSLVWAVTACCAVPLLKYAGVTLTAAQLSSCAFISFIITQFVVLSEVMREKSLFAGGTRINNIYLFFIFVLAGVIALSLVMPGIGAMLSVIAFPAMAWATVFAVPLVMLIVLEIYKLTSGKRD